MSVRVSRSGALAHHPEEVVQVAHAGGGGPGAEVTAAVAVQHAEEGAELLRRRDPAEERVRMEKLGVGWVYLGDSSTISHVVFFFRRV